MFKNVSVFGHCLDIVLSHNILYRYTRKPYSCVTTLRLVNDDKMFCHIVLWGEINFIYGVCYISEISVKIFARKDPLPIVSRIAIYMNSFKSWHFQMFAKLSWIPGFRLSNGKYDCDFKVFFNYDAHYTNKWLSWTGSFEWISQKNSQNVK